MELVEEALEAESPYPVVRFDPPDGRAKWNPIDAWDGHDWTHWLTEHHRQFHSDWTPARISQYLKEDRYRYGLGARRTPAEPLRWFYLPGPAAIPFHAATEPNVLYGGAAGGMKSHTIRWDAYRHCLAIPQYRSILMRRTFEELRRNHLDRAIFECETLNQFFGTEVARPVKSEHEILFPKTAAKLIFGHCQNPGDEERYLGDEYDDFRPDEMATFEQSQIVGVAGRLRSTKRGVRARLLGSSNPGGAKTLWLRRWFIDRAVTAAEHPRYRPSQYRYIPARLYDNPYLMDEDGTYQTYEDRLLAYAPQRRRQLLLGDWDAITGQFFPEFSAATHVRVLEIPPGCRIERWIDWGYSPNPGVCHWVACFPNGRLYVFAEWVFNGEGRLLRVAGQVAAHIRSLTQESILPLTRGTLSKTIADPSMFAKSGHTGESYAETFFRHGVPLVPADNDRVLGWGRLRHWLRPHPEGGRWLMYHPDCRYAIRSLPSLVVSPTNPDDCDTSGEDHAADADRYGVMARPSPSLIRLAPQPTIPGSVGELLASLTATPSGLGLIH